jgi:hypothetical protein
VIREALNATVAGKALEKFAERSTGLCKERANGEAGFQDIASGTSQTFGGIHSLNHFDQEIVMKSIVKAFVVGSLIVATQAAMAAGSPFPSAGDDNYGLPVFNTYADRHANDPVTSAGSRFPSASDDNYSLPVFNTYADRHANDPVKSVVSPFPTASDDNYGLPVFNTYADRHANDPVKSAGSTSPTAGDE